MRSQCAHCTWLFTGRALIVHVGSRVLLFCSPVCRTGWFYDAKQEAM